MKIVFHIGPHKTASTHLQNNLKLNEQILSQNGIRFINIHRVKDLKKHALLLRRNIKNEEFNLQETYSVIQNSINREIEGYKAAIISYEGILGDMNHSDKEDIYPNTKDIIKVYSSILEKHDVTIVMAARNYDDFLRSGYKWLLKNKEMSLSLNSYLNKINFSDGRWSQILSVLDHEFNGELKFFTQEDYKSQGDSILKEFLKLTGQEINLNDLEFVDGKINVSKNKNILNVYYTINAFFQFIPNLKYKRPIYKKMITEAPEYFNNSFSSFFLLKHSKSNFPPLNDYNVYLEEVNKLKAKYGILNNMKASSDHGSKK